MANLASLPPPPLLSDGGSRRTMRTLVQVNHFLAKKICLLYRCPPTYQLTRQQYIIPSFEDCFGGAGIVKTVESTSDRAPTLDAYMPDRCSCGWKRATTRTTPALPKVPRYVLWHFLQCQNIMTRHCEGYPAYQCHTLESLPLRRLHFEMESRRWTTTLTHTHTRRAGGRSRTIVRNYLDVRNIRLAITPNSTISAKRTMHLKTKFPIIVWSWTAIIRSVYVMSWLLLQPSSCQLLPKCDKRFPCPVFFHNGRCKNERHFGTQRELLISIC